MLTLTPLLLLSAPLNGAMGMVASVGWSCPLSTWSDLGKLYQGGRESRLEGRILDSRVLRFMDGPSALCLLVDAKGRRTVLVVAPLRYLEFKGILLAPGLRIDAKGVLSPVGSVTLFIPQELRVASHTVVLRDRWGKPLWREASARPPPDTPRTR